MISKDAELAILDKAIEQLGTDSYLGEWLGTVRDDVARAVSNDFMPEVGVAEAAQRAAYIVKEAESKACSIIAETQVQSEKIMKEAKKVRDEVGGLLRHLLHRVENY